MTSGRVTVEGLVVLVDGRPWRGPKGFALMTPSFTPEERAQALGRFAERLIEQGAWTREVAQLEGELQEPLRDDGPDGPPTPRDPAVAAGAMVDRPAGPSVAKASPIRRGVLTFDPADPGGTAAVDGVPLAELFTTEAMKQGRKA